MVPVNFGQQNQQNQFSGFRGGRGRGGRGRGGNRQVNKNYTQKRERSSERQDKQNNKKNKGSSVTLDDQSVSKIAQVLKKSDISGNATKNNQKKISNFMIGAFENILNEKDGLKQFYQVFKSRINTKLNYVPCSNINLSLHMVPDDVQVNHIILSFASEWFNDILSKANSKNAGEDYGKARTFQIFDAVYEKLSTQIASIRQHYRPAGVIFVVLKSGSETDSVLAALASQIGLTMIQINNFGRGKVDDKFGPKELAGRIAEVVKLYKSPTNLENGSITLVDQGQIIDCDNL